MDNQITDSQISIVAAFQKKIELLADKYLKSESINSIIAQLPNDKYDKENLIYGLWYYLAIYDVPSRHAYTIDAYEYGFIPLKKIMEDKIWLLENWSENSLFNRFNEMLQGSIDFRKARQSWHIQNSLESISILGRNGLLKLHNDEKTSISNELNVSQNDKLKLLKSSKKAGLYIEIYEFINVLRKENITVDKAIEKAINKFKTSNVGLKNLLKKYKNDKKEVISYLHNSYYKTKYSKNIDL